MSLLSSSIVLHDQLKDFELHEREKLQKPIHVPFFMYVRNINTDEYIFLEINNAFLKTHFPYNCLVTRYDIVRKISKDGYRIMVESERKSAVINNIKKRFTELLEKQSEFNSIKKIFEKNPEYLI